MHHLHRNTLLVEDAEVLSNQAYAGGQHVLRIRAPGIASRAHPGCFAHIRCGERLDMRRPMSIMRVDKDEGWAELLYKRVGTGTKLLAEQREGCRLSVLGPIGVPFHVREDKRLPLLIGGGVGIPPMVFLAERLRDAGAADQCFVIMGSEVPFPFTPRPSEIMVPGVPEGAIACMPLIEDWGIASRLASQQGYAGCFEGYVTDLARTWLDALDERTRREVCVYACGPTPMLRATASLASEFGLPSQVCLEEYMACAVGGCAGCVVPVRTPDGPAMKRVCVDGPVFVGDTVAWQ